MMKSSEKKQRVFLEDSIDREVGQNIMIRIGTIDEMEQDSGEKWMIVRSPKEIPVDAKHVPALSPSLELFQVYKEARKKGIWDEDFFQKVYVSWFLADLRANQETLDLLDYLCRAGKTRDFYLCCYCTKECECICHRSIIAGVLQGRGALVIGSEYRKYSKMLKKLENE